MYAVLATFLLFFGLWTYLVVMKLLGVPVEASFILLGVFGGLYILVKATDMDEGLRKFVCGLIKGYRRIADEDKDAKQ